MHSNDIKIWDIVVRVFHWSLVITFFLCYLTEDSSSVHINSGYIAILLVILRIIWGFIGTKYARFENFVVTPPVAIQYLKDIFKKENSRFIGHNPAGATMIIVLICSIILTCVTGIVLYGVEDQSGPLAFLFVGENAYVIDIFEEAHEFFSNFSVVLVVLHVLGVIIAGKQHNENLIKSMINGYKKKSTIPDSKD